MATVLPSFLFLIILYFIFKIPLMFAQDDQFIYNGFHEAKLHQDGIAEIHPNGLLQLTNTSNQQVGYAFYQLPLKFNTSSSGLSQSPSFSTNFDKLCVYIYISVEGQDHCLKDLNYR